MVKETALTCGVNERYVRYVINGERENETVMSTYMALAEGSNKLLDEVKKLVPFE